MGKYARDKGLRGEREVRLAFQGAGFEVRGLEGEGDNLIVCADDLLLHVETKRQETLRLPDWIKQADDEAPGNAVPLVIYRKSNMPWRVDLSLEEFLHLLQRATK